MQIREVWGFDVPVDHRGRNLWPAELKAEVVRRIQEEGGHPPTIAKEIGSTDQLVRKWERASRPSGFRSISNMPAFGEVSIAPTEFPLDPEYLQRTDPAADLSTVGIAVCRLRFGDMILEFPGDIDLDRLAAFVSILRKVASV